MSKRESANARRIFARALRFAPDGVNDLSFLNDLARLLLHQFKNLLIRFEQVR
jgi:hypothetical protein